jgi:hypothetical protein
MNDQQVRFGRGGQCRTPRTVQVFARGYLSPVTKCPQSVTPPTLSVSRPVVSLSNVSVRRKRRNVGNIENVVSHSKNNSIGGFSNHSSH